MKGQTLYSARSRMGEELAREDLVRDPGFDADLVIPVPDTGKSAAIGYSAASGISLGEGLVKNRYVGRTFIDPDDELRKLGIRMKLNPLSSTIRGKRLIVVDDSIVRGNTTRQLVRMLRDAGASEVHLRISSPPIVFPCFYGIDMASQDEFIAFEKSVGDISRELGADSVAYLSLDGLLKATRVDPDCFCTACFQRGVSLRRAGEAAPLEVQVRGRRGLTPASRWARLAPASGAGIRRAALAQRDQQRSQANRHHGCLQCQPAGG
jgi:amidophosphoribosyltransferase